MRHLLSNQLSAQLSAIAQIYLQTSPALGAAVLLGLYLTQPALALGCLLGAAAASASAWLLGFPEQQRRQGLYSFNAALSGAGLCASFQPDAALAAWIVLVGAGTALLSRYAQRLDIPALTSPFVLVMWLSSAVATLLGLQPTVSMRAADCGTTVADYLFCVVGQASFIGPSACGLLVWALLARSNWKLAESMLVGGAMAWLVSRADVAHGGSIGINCALTALALATFGRPWPQRLLGTTFCLALCAVAGASGQAYFTLPFVLATWLVLSLRGRWRWNTIGL